MYITFKKQGYLYTEIIRDEKKEVATATQNLQRVIKSLVIPLAFVIIFS